MSGFSKVEMSGFSKVEMSGFFKQRNAERLKTTKIIFTLLKELRLQTLSVFLNRELFGVFISNSLERVL